MLAAIILSAGESSRMGAPKALLPFSGKTFLEHLLEITKSSSQIDCTRVVLGPHAEEIREKVPLDPASVVLNPDWKSGQLSSIQAAIESLPRAQGQEQTDGILLLLVDHPLVSAELVGHLIGQFYASGKTIVLPTYRGRRGHPVLFAQRLYGELLGANREQGARAVVWAHASEVLEVPTEEEGVVLNLNDPEAVQRAAKLL